MNEFLDKAILALDESKPGYLPYVETNLKVIQHYNRGSMDGFNDAGYFVFQGVKVILEGTRAEVERKENMTMEERNHARS
jgi:hypothetical protein